MCGVGLGRVPEDGAAGLGWRQLRWLSPVRGAFADSREGRREIRRPRRGGLALALISLSLPLWS